MVECATICVESEVILLCIHDTQVLLELDLLKPKEQGNYFSSVYVLKLKCYVMSRAKV